MATGHAWSNVGMPAAEQRAAWEHAAAETWVPVLIRAPDEAAGCPASVAGHRVGPLTVARISTCAQSVLRLPQQVNAAPGDQLFLNLPLIAGTTAAQNGRRAAMRAGDFAVVDGSGPFELDFPEGLRQVSVSVPRELLLERLGRPQAAMGVRVDSRRGVGAVAAGAVRGLAAAGARTDHAAERALARHVIELVALALGPSADPQTRLAPDLILQAALDEVERSLGDPELSPGEIADRVGISVRYLHRLFSDAGPSFGRWLLGRRLDRSREALRDARQPARPIADIAREHGFSDPSYFARAYRARHGHAPREERRGGTTKRLV